jgi:hypothetical protein
MRSPLVALAGIALAAIVLAGIVSPSPARAVEPGTDDTRAGLCDAFAGAAFTFCVAFCEARECDRQPAGDERCALLRRGFSRVTGGATPPCLDPAWTGRDAAARGPGRRCRLAGQQLC